MKESEGIEITVREIQGFREGGRGAVDAGRFNPAWDAGMAPQRMGRNDTRVDLLLPERARSECARSTAAVRPDTGAVPEEGERASVKGELVVG
jgi:hypothetical protein